MSSLTVALSLLASLFIQLSDAHPHSSGIGKARGSIYPSPTIPHAIRDGAHPSLAPPNSTIIADPVASDRPDNTSAQDRTHIIVACVLALVLIAACFFIIRYLEHIPFQRRRRIPPPAEPLAIQPHTQTPAAVGPEAGFGFSGLDKTQWQAATESLKGDGGSIAESMPEKPPAVFLKEKLPLSPIEVDMPVVCCVVGCYHRSPRVRSILDLSVFGLYNESP